MKINYCSTCEFADTCEIADITNFCDDCKDCDGCTLKYVTCQAGHDIECNNGFEPNDDYCSEDEDEEEMI